MKAMSARVSMGSRLFAAIGLAAALVGAIGTIVVRLLAPAPFIPVGFGYGGATMVGFVIEGLSWASIGALLVIRRPGNAVGWLMVLIGVGHTLSQLSVSLTFAFAAEGTAQGERLAQIAGWATVLLQLVGVFQVAIGFLYPSGRAQSRGWARFMRLFWASAVPFVVISLIQPGPLQLIPALQNPFGFGPDLRGGRTMAPFLVLWTVIIFVALGISMVSRYRSAGRVERQQLKWFALALGLSTVGLGIATWETMLGDRPANAIGLTVFVLAGALVPIAIGIAILRHHLYDIDRIISRTIAYGFVTAILGAIFLGGVLGGQTVLASVLRGDSSLMVAASTLVTFALFQPVRRRVQAAVDRRFDRGRIDADRTIDLFATRLRDDLDLNSVTGELSETVRRSMAPRSIGVWLRRA